MINLNKSYTTKYGNKVRGLRFDPANPDFPIRGQYLHYTYGWIGHAWDLHGKDSNTSPSNIDLVESSNGTL